MKNDKYRPVQIPVNSYEKLSIYCSQNGYKLGKFLEVLINKNCKIEEKRILKVNTTDD